MLTATISPEEESQRDMMEQVDKPDKECEHIFRYDDGKETTACYRTCIKCGEYEPNLNPKAEKRPIKDSKPIKEIEKINTIRMILPTDLANKMQQMISNYEPLIEMGKIARKVAIEKFDIKNIASQYESVLIETVNNK